MSYPTLLIMYEQSVRANKRALSDFKKFGMKGTYKNNQDSTSRVMGLLGEEALSYFFGVEIQDKPDYDLIVDGKRIEVKSRSINKAEIYSHYEVHAFNGNNYDKDCDFYIFPIIRDLLTVKIVGYISKKRFINDSWIGNYRGVKTKMLNIYQLNKLEVIYGKN